MQKTSNVPWKSGSKSNYKKDSTAVAQNVRTRLQSFLGDCFFATDEGIDWFNLLGSKRILELKLNISSTILNTQDVTSLVEIYVNILNNRQITVIYSANTIYGPVIRQTINQGI